MKSFAAKNEHGERAQTDTRAPGASGGTSASLEPTRALPQAQRKASCACGGGCGICQTGGGDSRVVKISRPGDAAEIEADRIADQVTRPGNAVDSFGRPPAPAVQAESDSGITLDGDISAKINSTRDQGKALNGDTRQFYESRLGAGLGDVRIHTGRRAADLNERLSARAFTVGNHIYFNEGQYEPRSEHGRHLLAHELVHTRQQKNAAGGARLLQRQSKEFSGGDIPKNSIDSLKFDTYFNKDGSVAKVVSPGTGKAILLHEDDLGAITEIILPLTNHEIFDRANWVYGEGGGNFSDRYAMTVENLRQSGRSGYGTKPFVSDEEMYQRTMKHGSPPKSLYPAYFSGKSGGWTAKKFANARRDYADISSDQAMLDVTGSVLKSITGELTNEGYNNWRGSGNKLYTAAEREKFEKTATKVRTEERKVGKKVVGVIKTEIDHFWEPVGSKFRRHTFHRITFEKR